MFGRFVCVMLILTLTLTHHIFRNAQIKLHLPRRLKQSQ